MGEPTEGVRPKTSAPAHRPSAAVSAASVSHPSPKHALASCLSARFSVTLSLMPLSNAERQRRFKERKRQRLHAQQSGWPAGNDHGNDGGNDAPTAVTMVTTVTAAKPKRRDRARAEYLRMRQMNRQTALAAPIKRGTPCKFTPELAERILNGVLEFGSLERACAEPGMPSTWSVYQWGMREPAFLAALARVREMNAERWLEEMLLIADDETLDPLSRKVRTETRRWAITAVAPGRYGGKGDGRIGSLGATEFADAIEMPEMSAAQLDLIEQLALVRLDEMEKSRGPLIEGSASAVEDDAADAAAQQEPA